jgi:hypothetical protein
MGLTRKEFLKNVVLVIGAIAWPFRAKRAHAEPVAPARPAQTAWDRPYSQAAWQEVHDQLLRGLSSQGFKSAGYDGQRLTLERQGCRLHCYQTGYRGLYDRLVEIAYIVFIIDNYTLPHEHPDNALHYYIAEARPHRTSATVVDCRQTPTELAVQLSEFFEDSLLPAEVRRYPQPQCPQFDEEDV